MNVDKKKLGRPKSTENREELTVVSFKADEDTLKAIDELVAAAKASGVRSLTGIKSGVLRQIICDAAKVLKK